MTRFTSTSQRTCFLNNLLLFLYFVVPTRYVLCTKLPRLSYTPYASLGWTLRAENFSLQICVLSRTKIIIKNRHLCNHLDTGVLRLPTFVRNQADDWLKPFHHASQ